MGLMRNINDSQPRALSQPVPKSKILIVDDRTENLVALSSVIESPDVEVIRATSGRDALRQLLRDDFALILLDAQMPGLDGFETAALIRQRERSRHTPIIFLTAFERNDEQVASAYELGAVDYILKPFVPEILRAKVAVFVELSRKTEEVRRQAALLEQRSADLERLNGDLQREVVQRRRAEQHLEQQALELVRSNENLAEANRKLEALYNKVRQLDDLKNEFFANVSHELRTPLALILGPTIERLRSSDRLSEEQREALEVIERNARHVLKHVNDLLDMSKLEAGRMDLYYEELDLARLLRAVAANFDAVCEERGIELRVETPASLTAEADGERVQRILLNLLSNALKFGASGGEIVCRLAADAARNSAILEVEDHGPGVPAEFQEIIFERFRQVDTGTAKSFGGTGLGLSIVRQLAELHGGDVAVLESPGGGALFRVTLPLKAPEGSLVAAARLDLPDASRAAAVVDEFAGRPMPEIAGQGERTVLLVEDHPEMRWFIAKTLAEHCRVEVAANGEEGWMKVRQFRPDLVVTDIMMPGGSGDEMVRRIRADSHLDGMPILVLTAKADDGLRVSLLRSGAQDYVLKPFSSEELLARVNNLLEIKKVRDLLHTEVVSQEHDVVALVRDLLAGREELRQTAAALAESEEQLKQYAAGLERKVEERTVELRDKNSQLESFAHSVAHDLRAPLRAMKGFSEALLEDYGPQLGEEGRLFATRIVAAVDRLDSLTSDLLAYCSLNRSDMQPELIDVQPVLDEAVEAVSEPLRASGAVLDVLVAPDVPPLLAHHATLVQAVQNLLTNAIKFVAPGTRPVIRVTVTTAGAVVRVAVQDNGIGIDPMYHERIFGVFERLHSHETYPGTGIGLAIVQKSIQRMGGRLGLESAPGEGSCFWFELPRAEGNIEQSKSHHLAG